LRFHGSSDLGLGTPCELATSRGKLGLSIFDYCNSI
jgi:hypothetical protein